MVLHNKLKSRFGTKLLHFKKLFQIICSDFPKSLTPSLAKFLKGLCKDISVHLHREEKSKNSPLKLMATCVVNNR